MTTLKLINTLDTIIDEIEDSIPKATATIIQEIALVRSVIQQALQKITIPITPQYELAIKQIAMMVFDLADRVMSVSIDKR
jgi:hypothetical protein